MIKSLVKNAVLIVAVIAGAVGASFLKSNSDAKATGGHDASASKSSDHGDKSKKSKKDSHDKKSKSGDKKDGSGGSDGSTIDYLKFKRQFVIPVMKDNKIQSLVIMNFNIELNDDAPSNSFTFEPKLRDAYMRDLLNLSNEGVFDDDLTSPETFEYIRETLLGSSRKIMPKGVQNILILDIAKRDN